MSASDTRFENAKWRIQLTVFDIPPLGTKPHTLNFCVQKLSQKTHRSTAFYRGDQVYYGPSLRAALSTVALWLEDEPVIPRKLKVYFEAEGAT